MKSLESLIGLILLLDLKAIDALHLHGACCIDEVLLIGILIHAFIGF